MDERRWNSGTEVPYTSEGFIRPCIILYHAYSACSSVPNRRVRAGVTWEQVMLISTLPPDLRVRDCCLISKPPLSTPSSPPCSSVGHGITGWDAPKLNRSNFLFSTLRKTFRTGVQDEDLMSILLVLLFTTPETAGGDGCHLRSPRGKVPRCS